MRLSADALPLERAMRQLETLPSGLTRTVTPTLPLCRPLDASIRYSRSGILEILLAGVKREKSPPPPGPLPPAPAPVPLPASAAPEVDALPVPATFAAAMGEWTGSFGSGATIDDGSAFFAAAPAGFFIAC